MFSVYRYKSLYVARIGYSWIVLGTVYLQYSEGSSGELFQKLDIVLPSHMNESYGGGAGVKCAKCLTYTTRKWTCASVIKIGCWMFILEM